MVSLSRTAGFQASGRPSRGAVRATTHDASAEGPPTRLARRALLAGVALAPMLGSMPRHASAGSAFVPADVRSIYELTATLGGEPFALSQFAGRALVVVNVASQ